MLANWMQNLIHKRIIPKYTNAILIAEEKLWDETG